MFLFTAATAMANQVKHLFWDRDDFAAVLIQSYQLCEAKLDFETIRAWVLDSAKFDDQHYLRNFSKDVIRILVFAI